MQVKAQLNNLRLAPRKVRAVAGLIRGKNVNYAVEQLEYYVRRPAPHLLKLIKSAIANAENNLNMVRNNLYIKELIVNEGVKLKRFRAKGFGRAAPIQKKTSHIKLVLGEITQGLRAERIAVPNHGEAIRKESVLEHNIGEARQIKNDDAGGEINSSRRSGFREAGQGRPEIKREMGKKRNILGNLGKRIFQRKSI